MGRLRRSVGDCPRARRREEVTLGKFSLENAGVGGVSWGEGFELIRGFGKLYYDFR